MGTDLLLSTLVAKAGHKPDWRAATAHVQRMDLNALIAAYEDVNQDHPACHMDKWPEEDDNGTLSDPAAAAEMLRGYFGRALSEVREAWDDGRRDASVFQIGRYDVLIGGGESGGDSVDICEAIGRVRATGCHLAAGFLSPEQLEADRASVQSDAEERLCRKAPG